MGKGFIKRERDLDEVGMSNHSYEFFRFYERHRKHCEQIVGIKPIKKIENNQEQTFYIDKHNFLFAIKKLDSFIIDNIHYVINKNDRLEIEERMKEFEEEFLNDKKYQRYIREPPKQASRELVDYNYKYVNYVIKCFEISHELSQLLQDSLMISTMSTRKKINYWNTKNFFENLSTYRDEITNDLSLFSFKNVIIHFKKILGYHYTYRLMIDQNDLVYIDKILNIVFSYLMLNSTIELIIRANKNNINKDEIIDIEKKALWIKKMLSKVYILTNKSLSERNILPKVTEKILIDRSLM